MASQQGLIRIIEEHGARAVALDDRLLVEEQYAGDGFPDTACELYDPYWTPIEANAFAVCDWLGY